VPKQSLVEAGDCHASSSLCSGLWLTAMTPPYGEAKLSSYYQWVIDAEEDSYILVCRITGR